jgi:menaquinone-9 beta-reductase
LQEVKNKMTEEATTKEQVVPLSSNAGAAGYDIAVIGGGLAGLALAIQSARAGYKVILFEKEQYPFHKVCGEYISLESWDFLEDLGVPLSQMNLPVIRRLLVSAPNGTKTEQALPLGGFGISRYKLDSMLADIAVAAGVQVLQSTKVDNVELGNEMFAVQFSGKSIRAKMAAGAFGKRSNLDIKWKRKFAQKQDNNLNNYIGVKYHIKIDWPDDLIALHNFKDGYCGISRIEDGLSCLCYLTTAKNLKESGNSIAVMEENILQTNPHLSNIFTTAERKWTVPVTISQISFDKKEQVSNHILFMGDAAGMITPLCGNGMSMALLGSKIAFSNIDMFLKGEVGRNEMELNYSRAWKKQFANRLKAGRIIQSMFGKKWITNIFIFCAKPFPKFIKFLIRQTHGQPF